MNYKINLACLSYIDETIGKVKNYMVFLLLLDFHKIVNFINDIAVGIIYGQ